MAIQTEYNIFTEAVFSRGKASGRIGNWNESDV